MVSDCCSADMCMLGVVRMWQVAAEYLDLASVAVEDSLANTAGATLYAADYLDAILELTSALQGR